MKLLKALGVLLLLILSLNITASAQDMPDISLLNKLGITDGDISEKENITRAEFAVMTVRFMNTNVPEARKVFSDVGTNDYGAAEITALYDLGYVSGDENGRFNPDEPILSEHAAKMLVCALGYRDVCSLNNSFLSEAQRLGIFRGVTVSGNMTGAECAFMLDNALSADVMYVKTYGDRVTYEYGKNRDALFVYFDLKTVDGVMDSVCGASLTGSKTTPKDSISIDGTEYSLADDISCSDLLGYRVKAYVDTEDDEVFYCRAYKNETVEIKSDDINKSRTSLKKIVTDENESYEISAEADWLYNGNGYFGITLPELLSVYGTVTLVDNDRDGEYETVSVYDYVSCAVSVVNYNTMALTDFYGNTTEPLEDAVGVNVIKDGKAASFNDISQSDIALVAVDKTKKYAKILVSGERVNGTVELIDGDEVQINGDSYKISPFLSKVSDFRIKLSPGNKVEVRLDAFGKAAYVRFSNSENKKYGYLMDIAFAGGLDGQCRVKLLADNGVVQVFDSVNSLRINGATATRENIASAFTSFGKFEPQLIRYTVNDEGKITKLFSAGEGSLSMDFPYAQRAQASGGLRVFAADGDFVYNADTVIFSVPMYPEDALDEDYTVSTQVKGEYKTSQIAAFDVNEYQIAAAVVRKNAATSNTGTITNDDKNYNPLLVVDTLSKKLNKKGEEEYVLHCYTKDGEADYYVKDDKYSLVKDLKKGDVILLRYNQATNHVIDVYTNIYQAVRQKTYGHADEIVSNTDGSRWFEWIYGKAVTRFGDTVKISDKPNPQKPSDYRVYVAGTAKVIIVSGDKISYGSLADVTPGTELVLRSRGPSVQEIIIYE